MGTLIAGSEIQVAKIPELSPLTNDLPLDLADQLPIYIASESKTKKVSLSALNTFFATGGGGGSHPPVAYGARYIYKVPPEAAGNTIVSLPTFSGLDFHLRRGGFPLEALLPDESNDDTAEYEILNAGGFKLLQDGDVLNAGERFELEFYSLIGSVPGSGSGGGTGSSGGFIKGKKVVTTNTTLDPSADVNKLIQVRSDSTAITITIPDIGDIIENAIIAIETNINNSTPTKIATSAGQYIYMNSQSRTSVDMHPGEVLWLYRDTDGLYVINDFYRHYRDLCKPIPSYEVGADEVLCKGQLLNRADYPRIWEKVSALGFSLVSDLTWSTASATVAGRTVQKPYRGCFSTGDGSTTFRMPDLMNVALRGAKTETGSDSERLHNKPGGFQRHEFESHTHDMTFVELPNGATGAGGYDGGSNQYDTNKTKTSTSAGGAESRMDNVAVYWVMKK